MFERTQWYQLAYNDTTGAGTAFGVELKLDSDAPFRMTGIAVWILGAGSTAQTQSAIELRYTGPDREFLQRHMIQASALTPAFLLNRNSLTPGTGANCMLFSPINPNRIYPPSGTIVFDIQTQPNAGPVDALIVVFGTKIFRDGACWSPSYPARYTATPFFGYGIQCNAANSLPLLNQPMPIDPDADFVWQAGTHSDFGGVSASTLLAGEEQGEIEITAVTPGTGGNAITIQVTSTGISQALSITVIGNAITIQLATDGGGAELTLTQTLADLINGTPAAAALVTATLLGGPGQLAPSTGGVIRNLIGGTNSLSNQLVDMGVKIKDYVGKYYMNDYIPVALVYGFINGQVPGLPYPEIYIPRNQALYFDFNWIASAAVPTPPTPNILTLTHKGMKVFSS
jgi:hypothetical protein